MLDINIGHDECITSNNLPNEVPNDAFDNKDDILNYSWKIIPYDYDEDRNDMAYYKLIVEGRTFNLRNKSSYGDSWELTQDEDNLWWMNYNDKKVRHDLTVIIREELSYYVNTYAKYDLEVEKYDFNIDTWEFFDLTQKHLLVRDDLRCMDMEITLKDILNMSTHERLNFVNEKIHDEEISSDILELTIEMEQIAKYLIQNNE